MFDTIIVGAGLSGSTIARELAQEGHRILVLERRKQVSGNLFDDFHSSGIRVQHYGPHIFHTEKIALFQYISGYGKFEPFNLECMVYMKGKFTPSPFNFQTIDDFYLPDKASRLKERLQQVYPGQSKVTIVEMLENSDPMVKEYADFLFESDYRPYTAKQWGIEPSEIDISVLKRVPVYLSYQTGYFSDSYQCIPYDGYTSIIKRMLEHENITVETGVDALDRVTVIPENGCIMLDGEPTSTRIVYTGAIDELFHYRYGKLPYRSLRFEWDVKHVDSMQPAPVVAYPQAPRYTRITEYKKLPVQNKKDITVYAKEYPLSFDHTKSLEPYYPIPTVENEENYQKYREAADMIPNLFLCGRLADYRYYNMDQALEKALLLAKQIKNLPGDNGHSD